jgi:hypothetical protein
MHQGWQRKPHRRGFANMEQVPYLSILGIAAKEGSSRAEELQRAARPGALIIIKIIIEEPPFKKRI